MKQPTKGSKINKKTKKKRQPKGNHNPYKSHSNNKKEQKYGTSKLERDFARDFLDKNGIVYIYQYEAKDIKRYFDYAITVYSEVNYLTEIKDGIKCVKQEGQYFPVSFMIEVDGGYYHSDPRIVDEDKLNPMQKHNKFVDKIKDRWCGMHCIPLLRIWEYDIRHNPKKVLEELSNYINIGDKRRRIDENRKKPH